MRIASVRVSNFRALRDVSVAFDDVTTFIGPNGAGKSTVLRALDWFFNGSKSGQLTDKDRSVGSGDSEIRVEVSFTHLSEIDRAELGKYVAAGVDSFTAWKTRTPAGDEYLSANAKGFGAFTSIKEATSATAKKEKYRALRDSSPELGLPAAATATAIDVAMTEWEAGHLDELVSLPESLQTNFFGFNSGGKMSGLFDFVLVTADFRAAEEALDSKSSVIGKILERTVDRTAADEEIEKIVEDSRRAQQIVHSTKFASELALINRQLNDVVASYSPGRTISVTPADIELKAPRTTFSVSIADGPTETSVEGQGHGFQRTLLISALQLLAQSGAAGAGGVICLAIEEPELFQHPIQAQAFARVLRSLAESPEQKIQVAYATHSPYFLEVSNFQQVRRLTRNAAEMPNVAVASSSISTVTTRLSGLMDPEKIRKQLDGTISRQLPVALFANRVLLVEGTTEEAVFLGLADKQSEAHLESLGLSVVAANGKGNILLIHAILSSLGIPTYCVFDSDSGCEARSRSLGKSEAKVADDILAQTTLNRNLLAYFGLPVVDFPPETETPGVTIFVDHLEEVLNREWPEWLASCESYAQESGATLEKNSAAYRSATSTATGKPSPLLLRTLEAAKTFRGAVASM